MVKKIDKNGYIRGDKKHSDLIHRQIAHDEIYLKNRKKYPLPFLRYVVHHKDGDKLNNSVSNLQILLPEEHDKIHGIVKKKRRVVSKGIINDDEIDSYENQFYDELHDKEIKKTPNKNDVIKPSNIHTTNKKNSLLKKSLFIFIIIISIYFIIINIHNPIKEDYAYDIFSQLKIGMSAQETHIIFLNSGFSYSPSKSDTETTYNMFRSEYHDGRIQVYYDKPAWIKIENDIQPGLPAFATNSESKLIKAEYYFNNTLIKTKK